MKYLLPGTPPVVSSHPAVGAIPVADDFDAATVYWTGDGFAPRPPSPGPGYVWVVDRWVLRVDPFAYQKVRAAAYPRIGDQLDAIWKYLAALPNPPAELAAMAAQIAAVKAQYPKPTEEV